MALQPLGRIPGYLNVAADRTNTTRSVKARYFVTEITQGQHLTGRLKFDELPYWKIKFRDPWDLDGQPVNHR